MNVEEILRILRENVKQKGLDFRSIRLPKGNKNKETIKFDLENKILSIKLDKESLFANMQTNEAAFEGWALCLKSWLKDKDGVPMVDKVMIKWDVIKGIKSEHYARFLYRVRKFIENYDWADADNREYIYSNLVSSSTFINKASVYKNESSVYINKSFVYVNEGFVLEICQMFAVFLWHFNSFSAVLRTKNVFINKKNAIKFGSYMQNLLSLHRF